jgi:hypothetical protein
MSLSRGGVLECVQIGSPNFVAAQKIQKEWPQLPDDGVSLVEVVVDPHPVPMTFNQPAIAQVSEMTGQKGLRKLKDSFHLTDAKRPPEQQV